MNLHLDSSAFLTLMTNVSERTNIRIDIIEKDYYITLMLRELSQKQAETPAYFKGGTALYKALKTLNRFSEDIDLTVEVSDCSTNQGKKRLEAATNKFQALPRTTNKELEANVRGSITSVYDYKPVVAVDTADALQRFGHIKIEATSFTVSEPYEALEIEPLLFTAADANEREILSAQFGVAPFRINTIKMERIFSDKILAAEFYYQRDSLFDVAKHLYDLTVMHRQARIQEMVANECEFAIMLSYKRLEEQKRIGSDLATKPFDRFSVFKSLEDDERLQESFERMQNIYVFNDADLLTFGEVVEAMTSLNRTLLSLHENLEAQTTEEFGMQMT